MFLSATPSAACQFCEASRRSPPPAPFGGRVGGVECLAGRQIRPIIIIIYIFVIGPDREGEVGVGGAHTA